jgi:sugar lactone lactonase YvrE
VDGRSNAYIGNTGFDFPEGEFAPGTLALVALDGSVRQVADGVAFPNGICLDAEGAVWYGDVPNRRCVRVREGGEVLQSIELDRGCFACMLGGPARSTLFMVAQEWGGMESTADGERARF